MPGKSSGNRGRQHPHHQSRRRKFHKMTSGSSGDPTADAEVAEAFPEHDGETHQLLDISSQPKMTRAAQEETENVWSVSVQVFIPFLVAGLGMVGAGLVLDVVQVTTHIFWCNLKQRYLKMQTQDY